MQLLPSFKYSYLNPGSYFILSLSAFKNSSLNPPKRFEKSNPHNGNKINKTEIDWGICWIIYVEWRCSKDVFRNGREELPINCWACLWIYCFNEKQRRLKAWKSAKVNRKSYFFPGIFEKCVNYWESQALYLLFLRLGILAKYRGILKGYWCPSNFWCSSWPIENFIVFWYFRAFFSKSWSLPKSFLKDSPSVTSAKSYILYYWSRIFQLHHSWNSTD